MIIGGQYGFNGGDRVIPERWSDILEEIEDVIAAVDVESHKRKKSKEKTMPGQMLYSPKTMNKAFDERFFSQDWERKRIRCDYPTKYYREGTSGRAFETTSGLMDLVEVFEAGLLLGGELVPVVVNDPLVAFFERHASGAARHVQFGF